MNDNTSYDLVRILEAGRNMQIRIPNSLRDVRDLRFYPRMSIMKIGLYGSLITALNIRYSMARYLEEIEDNIDLKDFENAAVRLIGGEPNPNRSVIFVDYAISSGTTLGCCALDFQRLGYDTEKMYFTQGHEIDPLKNWIGELSHLESCFGRFDITPEQWKEYHEQLQAVLRKQGLAD